MGQIWAQRDKLRLQTGLLGNHMAPLRAQMSQPGINQLPKRHQMVSSSLALLFIGLELPLRSRAAAPIGDKVLICQKTLYVQKNSKCQTFLYLILFGHRFLT